MKAAQHPRILRTSAAALLALVVSSPLPLKATPLIWTGAIDNNWETGAAPIPPGAPSATPTNWTPFGFTPATDGNDSDITFTGAANTNTVINVGAGANTFLASITYAAAAANFSISSTGGDTLTLEDGGFIINNSPNLQVISLTNTAGGALALNNLNFNGGGPPFGTINTIHFTAAAGDILITNDVSFQTPITLIIDGSHNLTMTGAFFDAPGGSGTITKNGTGTLFLTGNSTYVGDTTVNGGVLKLTGSIASLRTFVNAGGTLSGTGSVGGNVYNSGNVQPGDAPGTLTVKGSYFQTKGGTLTIQVAGKNSGQYSVLAVGGKASLDGNLRIVNVGGSTPRLGVGEKITFLTANQGVQGQFANVSNPFPGSGTIVADQIVYGPNSVSLEGVQGSFAALSGLTPNQHSVAKALDHVVFRNKSPKLIGYLDNEPLGKLPGDFDKIAPEELTSMYTIGTALANVQNMNLQRRTDDIRSGSHGFSAAGFATAGSGPLYSGNAGVAGPSGNDGKDSKEMKAVAPPEERWGTFITGVGEWVSVGDDSNARGYDITTGGFTLGADYKVTPNLAIGLSAGYAGTGADLNNGGRVFVNGGKLGLYGTYFTGGFYVDTAVNGGYNSYDMHRDALQGTARGSTDGGELNVLFGTGYDWKVGALSFGPTATFQYTYLGISDFSETGSLAPLWFPSQHQDSVRTAFGMKASYDWKIGGVIVKPEVRAAWQHEYGDNSYVLNSSLEGAGGNLFNVNGPVLGRDSLLLGAGFAVMWNERTSTYVYYDGDLGRTRYDSQNVSGGIRVSF